MLSYQNVAGMLILESPIGSMAWRKRDRTLVVVSKDYYREVFSLPKRGWQSRMAFKLREAIALLNPLPCYLSVTQRDCDLYQTTNAYRFPCWHIARKALQEMRYHAEGPVSARRISKSEYLSFESSSRDIAAEMMGY